MSGEPCHVHVTLNLPKRKSRMYIYKVCIYHLGIKLLREDIKTTYYLGREYFIGFLTQIGRN
jgi:hypothetical protein